MGEVLTVDRYPTNGHLIEACFRLRFLDPDLPTLDPTLGGGVFWRRSRPGLLIGTDLDPARAADAVADFQALPFRTGAFGQAVFDPGYKLNGTPSGPMDDAYGVGTAARWQTRLTLMLAGLTEVCRVVDSHRVGRRRPPARVLVKCKDQVVSGRIRWQTRLLTERAEVLGFGLEARFDYLAHRPQPDDGRPQKHPRANTSQLLVLRKGWEWRP